MKKILMVVAFSIFAVGCASKNLQHPSATMYPSSTQQKMQAVSHWDILAANEAKLISAKLSGSPLIHINCKSSSCSGTNNHSSPFSEAYSEFLTSHLVNNGAQVAVNNEQGAFNLEYHVQVVTHNDRDGLRPKPGTLSVVGAISYGIYKAVNDFSHPARALIPLAILGDLALYDMDLYNSGDTATSNTEVLVTTKVTKENRVITSHSSIYYFNAGDVSHYEKSGMAVTNVN